MITGVLTETMNGGPSDDDLVARLLAARSSGTDQEAEELFALLVHRHQRRVFKLVLSVLGPGRGAEAEDLTQEVFLKVYRRLDSFRSESRFSTWLYRIAYRRAIDLKRLARFHMLHVDDEVLASLPTEGETAPAPYRNTLNSEARIKLYAAVMVLPQLQRSAVLLHYWMDEDVETIAKLLDRRPGTIKSLLFRARKRLARLLGKDGRELLT
jgi:RNA polymerase sigma-70 factor (ECF subfamily)